MKESTDAEFTAFVEERGAALVRIAYAMTGDQRSAEDLVQAALAKAYTRWPRIRDDAEPYLRRIIYNDRVSIWRRQSRIQEFPVAEVPEPPPGSGHDHDTTLRLALRQALLTLPARQRAVLVLRYLEDRSVDETAELLGCRRGTVASQATRALRKLRELIPDLNETLTAEVLR
ncbi:RNA polymerase sigma-70 factor (sigma-E family) [Actinoplanes octamycinicus]|uniref:RNA polymerase sigma-70 factor (Sigma-E family) n=1 Tax=Actinoplanes octamycinicus TaxID=135948 RepID=A0A7W7GTN2_9ACTN|nr:SigE family RNA polymerase sigma factor [Actinoplanes octamycinicus]MBB4738103.1 RNA polymerase sigma-70 factor (sigma-E family) [Actinoplanes octamycinicus]GIE59342.1 DNA-directed RNA polymerase sigma-70 factor [Actinoplanes octamycinicus]